MPSCHHAWPQGSSLHAPWVSADKYWLRREECGNTGRGQATNCHLPHPMLGEQVEAELLDDLLSGKSVYEPVTTSDLSRSRDLLARLAGERLGIVILQSCSASL